MSDLAVVGGATGALGSEIASELRAGGLRVVGVSRSGDTDGAVAADLSDDAAIETIRSAVDGPVKMIVQAAGLPGSGSIETITGDEVAAGFQAKIGGLLRMIRGCEEHLGEGSRIVVLGGHYGYEPSAAAPLAGMVNAALANLVRSLSDHWGPRGVTVHLVAPGPVESPRMSGIAERMASKEGTSPEAVLDRYRNASPLGRLTTIQEVAWAVKLLLDDEAAALHGTTLSLDAGRRRGNA